MPRPKGSKNKKNRETAPSVEEVIAQRTEAKAALEAQRDEILAEIAEKKAELKAVRAEIKKIDTALAKIEADKAAAEAQAAKEAAHAAVEEKINALLAEGKSMEDILNKLG